MMISKITTLVELLGWRAANQTGAPAYTFLKDGEMEEQSFTYDQLDRQARAIGAELQAIGASGERVLLLYHPGLEFIPAFFGCLYAGAVAVPAYPPRLNQNRTRIQAIVADAQVSVVLSTATDQSWLQSTLCAEFPQPEKIKWLATDCIADRAENDWREPAITGASLAFLQYTSGSTGTPKGVMLSHENLLSNAALVCATLNHTAEDRYVSWLPTFYDMGFMAGILEPLYGGLLSIQMSPASFLQRPVRWLQAITRYKATTSGGPNFAYDLCVRKISLEQRESLDLSRWNVAFNGAEPIRSDTIERFSKAFEPYGFRRESFYPCYGLAEATLIVSGGLKSAPPVVTEFLAGPLEKNHIIESPVAGEQVRTLVGCGKALQGQQVIIVDPDTLKQCSPGQVGEIWVAGPSVAQGYWNRPDEVNLTFRAQLSDAEQCRFLRTGDLGFFLNSELYVTGRLKDLIIIRGRNIYPQDIESSVEHCDPALRPGCNAAFSVVAGGEERIAVVQEVDVRKQPDLDKIIEKIRRLIVEEYEVNAYAVVLIKAGSIFKTSSGKIQRYACRDAFISSSFDVIATWIAPDDEENELIISNLPVALESIDGIERWLATQIAARLKTDLSDIDINRPVIEYGLDSIMTIEVMHAIETQLGISLPVTAFLQGFNVSQLANEAFSALKQKPAFPQKISHVVESSATGVCDLSIGQQALWFLHKAAPQSAAYNISGAMRIIGPLDVTALRNAFQLLVNRHAALRVIFGVRDGKPGQQVLENLSICFQLEDASTWDESAIRDHLTQQAHYKFDLENESLLRVSLLACSSDEYILVVVAHHIIVDLWSLTLLMHELNILYEAQQQDNETPLPPLKLQYSDYVRWQAGLLAGPEAERNRAYWRHQIEAECQLLDLPSDKPRPPVRSYRGDSLSFNFGPELTRKLKSFCRAQGITLYTILLGAFQALLHRYTGQKKILVGSPTSGRNQAGFADVVGYFVNPVAMKADFSGDPAFSDFLKQLYQTVLDALEHQDYPFALLVEQIQPARDLSRSPIFDVMFALQKPHLPGKEAIASLALGHSGSAAGLGNLFLESIAIQKQVAQFDIVLTVADVNDDLLASLDYSTDLFEAKTIEQLRCHYELLLEAVIANPLQRISQLPLLTETEREQLLVEWNQTQVAYPEAALCLHELFERQVARTPDAVAVVNEDEHLSYAELDSRANRLSRYLRKMGVMPESLLGIMIERCPDMVVGLLGILKSGGAYVPLDPAYPRERLNFMLADCGARIVVTQSKWVEKLDGWIGEALFLDKELVESFWEPEQKPICAVMPENPAYIIYTSGSTGTPKGVVVEHRSLSNYLQWSASAYFAEAGSGTPVQSSISFDLTVTSLFSTLLTGQSVILLPDQHGVDALGSALRTGGDYSVIKITPTHLQLLNETVAADEALRCAKAFIIGGESLSAETLKFWLENAPNTKLINEYGPTEATVGCCVYQVESGLDVAGNVAIGCPIANTEMYVLDEYMQPVPVGMSGEICIGVCRSGARVSESSRADERTVYPASVQPGAGGAAVPDRRPGPLPAGWQPGVHREGGSAGQNQRL